jgi:hypothetical protein
MMETQCAGWPQLAVVTRAVLVQLQLAWLLLVGLLPLWQGPAGAYASGTYRVDWCHPHHGIQLPQCSQSWSGLPACRWGAGGVQGHGRWHTAF